MKISKHSFVGFLIVLPLILAVISGLKTYDIWPQITYMWQSRLPLLTGFQEFGAHGLRYALMYPIMWSSEYTGISADKVFSYVILVIVYFTGRNCIEAIRLCRPGFRQNVMSSLIVFGGLVGLFFLMNGRISVAFLGYSLLLRALLESRRSARISLKSGMMMLCGVILCGVSSGVLVSAVGVFLMTLGINIAPVVARMQLTRTNIILLLVTTLLIYTIGNSVVIGMIKNLTFYGGIAEMLHHGYGRILLNVIQGVPSWLFVTVLIAIILLGIRLLKLVRYPHLTAIFLFACACGAFGFSTLSIAAVPGLVLVTLYVSKTGVSPSRTIAPSALHRT
ncbi:hypothetical protein G5B38_20070 (plasmid) [Pseudohalocynthiibacter aestuariivivens]|uniref:Uncharacterized protein n=1 Tax=Roseovarius pelagicus TaxID=2980108 RepID=A0ABY6D5G7_9RHOB|nr:MULTISPECIES: hypothetical protein [Rhodobacterales]QIE47913.1 hypothetical protein G5B38_20070 [Pseudohalocynthiibacter aestuariivivens]UXX81407.1 hypothetical protein N7U68_00660 [Roseovarius pelagicus]